jgi:hypothetical protein
VIKGFNSFGIVLADTCLKRNLLRSVRMAYGAEISRGNPTCFIFLLDQSASMADPFGGEPVRKADFVADAVNWTLHDLVIPAVGGLMALMALGTSVGWLAIWPLLSQSQTSSPRRSLAPGNQPQAAVVSEKVNSQVEAHVKRAQALVLHSELAAALGECDRALRIDPGNGRARWLRDRISKTQDILQERRTETEAHSDATT